MFNRLLLSTLAIALLVLAGTARAGDAGIQVVFTDNEVSVIRNYYREHGVTHPRGRKGRKSLPPGIAKNLRAGKSLPPGIAKQVLPGALIDLLPPAPRGFERIEVAGKILLVEIATRIIHDVLEDLVFR